MLSLEEYKEALGEELLKELSGEQIIKLRDLHDQLAEAFFVMWLDKKD